MTEPVGAAERRVDYMPLPLIQAAPRNPKKHATSAIRASINRFGVGELPLLDERTGRLVAGHGRLDDLAARQRAGEEPPDGVRVDGAGTWLVPIVRGWASRTDDEAEAYLVASNQLTVRGGWDDDELATLLSDLADADPELFAITGFTPDDLAAMLDDGAGGDGDGGGGGDGGDGGDRPGLADKFLLPPFDVLDTRQGWWRERKKMWLGVGFRSEVGRDDRLTFAVSANPDFYTEKSRVEKQLGRTLTTAEFTAEHYVAPDTGVASGTSVFDPVLCELAYRWFCPTGGTILDPFSGGSVRGLVGALLGRQYIGNDLSDAQVRENREQAEQLLEQGLIAAAPQWSVGDSADWVGTLPAGTADLIFTCPPYYDLEQYSDDPADLSSMGYDAFDAKYAAIIAGAAAALKQDRFAVFVVGDVRDSKGVLHDLRGSTIRAAAAAGLTLASGAVLINMVGSAAMRASRQFSATRTLCRLHQDVLVFCKGDRSRAATACGEVEVYLPEGIEGAVVDPVTGEVADPDADDAAGDIAD